MSETLDCPEVRTIIGSAETESGKCSNEDQTLIQVDEFLEIKDEGLLLSLLEHAGNCKYCASLLAQNDELMGHCFCLTCFGHLDVSEAKKVLESSDVRKGGDEGKSED